MDLTECPGRKYKDTLPNYPSLNRAAAGCEQNRMMFGSGPVEAVVASDKVRVGTLQTDMPDGQSVGCQVAWLEDVCGTSG